MNRPLKPTQVLALGILGPFSGETIRNACPRTEILTIKLNLPYGHSGAGGRYLEQPPSFIYIYIEREMYVCMHTHILVDIHIYTHLHTYTHACIHTYIRVCYIYYIYIYLFIESEWAIILFLL